MACFGSPISTSVASPPPNARAHDRPLHRVGVLELVDEHDAVALAQPARVGRGRAGPVSAPSQPGEQVVVGEDPEPPLAPLELLARGLGEPDPHRRDRVRGRRPAGSIGAAGFSIAMRAIASASARGNCGWPCAVEAAHVEVVDDLGQQVGDVLDHGGAGAPRRPATPSPASTSWQKPCVVAIVAASKSDERAREPRAPLLHRARGRPPRAGARPGRRPRGRPPARRRARPRRRRGARAPARAARPWPCA